MALSASEISDKYNILEKLYKDFINNTGYKIAVGAEQEFYLCGKDAQLQAGKFSRLSNPFFSEIEQEEGFNQYEVKIMPTDNPALMARMIEQLRSELLNNNLWAGEDNISVSFKAKPYSDQPASALHIHVNIIDKQNNNLFIKKNGNESEILNSSIAGLIELMPASMKYFAHYDEAYIRYKDHGMESPSTMSWGANNRTVALRLPSVPLDPNARRIEHRVPCADANPYLVIAAIMAGLEFGITNRLENTNEKIWGNAFLPQYILPLMPHNYQEALKYDHAYLQMKICDLCF